MTQIELGRPGGLGATSGRTWTICLEEGSIQVSDLSTRWRRDRRSQGKREVSEWKRSGTRKEQLESKDDATEVWTGRVSTYDVVKGSNRRSDEASSSRRTGVQS